jgi:hypothetical protein
VGEAWVVVRKMERKKRKRGVRRGRCMMWSCGLGRR